MTKKDYIKIAAILKDHQCKCVDLVSDFANMLSEDNPHFDEKRFREACEK